MAHVMRTLIEACEKLKAAETGDGRNLVYDRHDTCRLCGSASIHPHAPTCEWRSFSAAVAEAKRTRVRIS